MRNPRFFQSISQIWQPNINIIKIISEFIQHLKKTVEVSEAEEEHIQTAFMQLKNLESYPFSALELSSNINEEQVADVFVRINSQGKTLNQADFILTLMSVFWEEGRNDSPKNFVVKLELPKETASPFNYLIDPDPDQMLRVSVGLAFRRARLQYVYSI